MHERANSVLYYQHSGRVGVGGLILMPIAGILAASVLGAAYGYWIYYCPVVYVQGIFPALFGAGVGAAVATGGRLGRARNTAAVGLIAATIGLLAEYVGWVSWIHAVTRGELIVEPVALWQMAQTVAVHGAWSVYDWTPTGEILYAIWALEGVVIVGASIYIAVIRSRSLPFCERCTRWTEPHGPLPRIASTGAPDALRLQLESGDPDCLVELGKAPAGATEFIELALHTCVQCKLLNVLTVTSVGLATDSDGKESRNETKFVDGLVLDANAAAMISSL